MFIRKKAVFLLMMSTLFSMLGIRNGYARESQGNTIFLPYTDNGQNVYEYLYVFGGYHSIDDGCPSWGTTDLNRIRFIGDSMGDIVVKYKDGTKDSIPLVFGYTMWWYKNWKDTTLPFKGEDAVPEMAEALKSALYLKGAYEAEDVCVFRVKLQEKEIDTIELIDNHRKDGEPVIKGAYLAKNGNGNITFKGKNVNADDPFFDTHTINSTDPYPQIVKDELDKINRYLMTYEDEYLQAPKFTYPYDYDGGKVLFSGTSIADIATGVFFHNLDNLVNRTDNDGFIHTSHKGALSYRYDGFGAWLNNANQYYDSFYSRDGGRAIMSLVSLGKIAKAQSAVDFGNKWMMYYPENDLTIKGVDIPGHWSVIPNKPLIYSKELTLVGWPTKYTEAIFGEGYQNLGNQETDGHGLMMLSNYNVWKAQGATKDWVEDNWKYINEAAEWILWCYEHPTISFVKDGLLYAESEGGLQDHTLYCNVPCYLGLLGYVQMAETVGKIDVATEWKNCADDLYDAICKETGSDVRGWVKSRFGFYHDPVITMMADYYGFDAADMDQFWLERSRITYKNDIGSIAESGYYGATGIGYDHSMITQNALLLDMMGDASELVNNLSKLSYHPGLPEPYIVPECIAVDHEAGIIRRQGDLGNLVQLSEALKCYAITIGVSPVNNRTLKLMPRLPLGWKVDVQDYDIANVPGKIDMLVTYPKDGVQTSQVTLSEIEGLDQVKFRFGPLPAETMVVAAQVNGINIPSELITSGDSSWAWVTLTPSKEKQKIALIYGNSVEELPAFPVEWEESENITENPPSKREKRSMSPYIIGSVVTVAVCGGIGAFAAVYRKRNKKNK